MKKSLLILAFVAAIAVSVVSCGKKPSDVLSDTINDAVHDAVSTAINK